MSEPRLQMREAAAAPHHLGQISLGRHLLETDLIAPWQLFYALDKQKQWDAPLGDILLSNGWITPEDWRDALARHLTAQSVNLRIQPPDPRLTNILPPDLCLKYNIVPWMSVGGLLILVTGRPEHLETQRPNLPPEVRRALIAVSTETDVETCLATLHRRALTRQAETRTDPIYSCRNWNITQSTHAAKVWGLIGASLITCAVFANSVLVLLTLWALFSLFAVATMKTLATVAHKRAPLAQTQSAPRAPLPRISIMVPLYKETEIAHALIARLAKLSYPKALLDVLLVLEEKDDLTRATISRTALPRWLRVVEVPAGSGLTTKPRALNYALDFCKGNIVGIWDAEDAPAPAQLEHVANHFAGADPDVACVQGVLDYYNPWTNWISRCFTIEYSTWFRVVLPGLARMGFPIPLGGTTLFLRRDVIEAVGGWDAHNVTEDADLGIRLARFGYRTELLTTVTQEEANCRPLAWVRQRSRWLKGYMTTYLVHMRSPLRLWSDIGPRQFLGVQLIFVATLSQFILAPLIWMFWGTLLGGGHPIIGWLPPPAMKLVAVALLCIGLINATIAARAISGQNRIALFGWILTMPLYFTLATLAAYKALFELAFRPFYWDKTAHGKTTEATSTT